MIIEVNASNDQFVCSVFKLKSQTDCDEFGTEIDETLETNKRYFNSSETASKTLVLHIFLIFKNFKNKPMNFYKVSSCLLPEFSENRTIGY